MDWSERYSTPLNDVFSRQHKLELEWRVELALLKALGEVGLVPKEAHGEVEAVIKCEEERGGESARPRGRSGRCGSSPGRRAAGARARPAEGAAAPPAGKQIPLPAQKMWLLPPPRRMRPAPLSPRSPPLPVLQLAS